jgi:methylated-DNA-[protein]-cysteine S-methyltransferase
MTTDALLTSLNSTLDPSPDRLQMLQDRLAAAAERGDLLDVAYRTVDSPVGPLLVAATERGVVRLAYAAEDHAAVLQRLADRISPRILRAPARLDPVTRELDEYFAGRRQTFDVAIDWRLSAGFRSVVLHGLAEIGYGQTASYTAVAARAGNPRAVRAVGSACATNPLPVLVPCHRVLRSDGSLGGYLGGLDAKRTLLALESRQPSPDAVDDFVA